MSLPYPTEDDIRRIISEELRVAMAPPTLVAAPMHIDPSQIWNAPLIYDQPLSEWTIGVDVNSGGHQGGYITTTGTGTYSTSDNITYIISPPAEEQKQSIELPDDLEILDECQIQSIENGEKTLEFWITGPTLPEGFEIPHDMFRALDREIKLAIVRAFRLHPPPSRKRLVIVDDGIE